MAKSSITFAYGMLLTFATIASDPLEPNVPGLSNYKSDVTVNMTLINNFKPAIVGETQQFIYDKVESTMKSMNSLFTISKFELKKNSLINQIFSDIKMTVFADGSFVRITVEKHTISVMRLIFSSHIKNISVTATEPVKVEMVGWLIAVIVVICVTVPAIIVLGVFLLLRRRQQTNNETGNEDPVSVCNPLQLHGPSTSQDQENGEDLYDKAEGPHTSQDHKNDEDLYDKAEGPQDPVPDCNPLPPPNHGSSVADFNDTYDEERPEIKTVKPIDTDFNEIYDENPTETNTENPTVHDFDDIYDEKKPSNPVDRRDPVPVFNPLQPQNQGQSTFPSQPPPVPTSQVKPGTRQN